MKSKRSAIAFLSCLPLAALLAAASPAAAWGPHAPVTRIATRAVGEAHPALSRTCAPTPLADFLRRNDAAAKRCLLAFHDWKLQAFPHRQWLLLPATRAALLAPAPLPPAAFKCALGVRADAFERIAVFPEAAPFVGLAAVPPDARLPFHTWLAIFADEPDAGQDIGLFSGDPRYGKIPFGVAADDSSQGPFHMSFRHENIVVRKARAELTQSMAHLRFLIMWNLAQVARSGGDAFWQARFLGQALHYLQDAAVPYHASAAPHMTPVDYGKALTASDREAFVARCTQLLTNRHKLYEMVASRILELARADGPRLLPGTVDSIRRGRLRFPPSTGSLELYDAVAKAAHERARKTDKRVRKGFDRRVANDPAYDLAADASFRLATAFPDERILAALAGREGDGYDLVRETRKDFALAVEATATLLARALAPAPPAR